jgi:GNAT superfamily N-acetyltransferase
MLNPFKLALECEFILFAEHNGECVGFTLCVPDYNPVFKKMNGNFEFLNAFSFLYLKKKIHEARLIGIGVVPSWRGKGLAPLLAACAYDAMIKKGYTKCEYSWVFRENLSSQNVAKKFHSDGYRTYSVYEKKIV